MGGVYFQARHPAVLDQLWENMRLRHNVIAPKGVPLNNLQDRSNKLSYAHMAILIQSVRVCSNVRLTYRTKLIFDQRRER